MIDRVPRYNSVAIALHWLVAIAIIGLLAVGKWMTSLPEADPLRFTATQWHKSFGILVLVLSVVRLIWKFAHRSPPLPDSMKAWEKFAAGSMHLLLYLLMFLLPITGWYMVSASPLNLSTLLFGVVPLPHLPIDWFAMDKEQLTTLFLDAHHLLSSVLLAMVIFHVLAALRHQFMLRDNVISRMLIGDQHRRDRDMSHGLIYGLVLAGLGVLALFAVTGDRAVPTNEGDTAASAVGLQVEFVATQLGEPLNGKFERAEIDVALNDDDPSASTMRAIVWTATASTNDSQVTITLPTADWFASEQYPEAVFSSTSIQPLADQRYRVSGEMQIKGVTAAVEFEMTVEAGVAAGTFEIDRSAYGIGSADQDGYVGNNVQIVFNFPVQ
jgi:cytochrome b561